MVSEVVSPGSAGRPQPRAPGRLGGAGGPRAPRLGEQLRALRPPEVGVGVFLVGGGLGAQVGGDGGAGRRPQLRRRILAAVGAGGGVGGEALGAALGTGLERFSF